MDGQRLLEKLRELCDFVETELKAKEGEEERDRGYLGYANNWGTEPKVVVECKEAGHRTESLSRGQCDTEYRCPTCGYWFRVDSSD